MWRARRSPLHSTRLTARWLLPGRHELGRDDEHAAQALALAREMEALDHRVEAANALLLCARRLPWAADDEAAELGGATLDGSQKVTVPLLCPPTNKPLG